MPFISCHHRHIARIKTVTPTHIHTTENGTEHSNSLVLMRLTVFNNAFERRAKNICHISMAHKAQIQLHETIFTARLFVTSKFSRPFVAQL